MTRPRVAFQRARRPEHKRQRYEAIVAAARELALRDGVRSVRLSDIAAAVGLHKSALLRYFATRDDIYLHIAADEWVDCAYAMRTKLTDAPAGSVVAVADAFAAAFAERPLLCDLLAHVPLTLERTVPLESVREYQEVVLPVLADLGEQVRSVLPELTDPDLLDLLLTVPAVAAALHQRANPPPTLARLRRWRPPRLEFTATLRRVAATYLTGLLTAPRED